MPDQTPRDLDAIRRAAAAAGCPICGAEQGHLPASWSEAHGPQELAEEITVLRLQRLELLAEVEAAKEAGIRQGRRDACMAVYDVPVPPHRWDVPLEWTAGFVDGKRAAARAAAGPDPDSSADLAAVPATGGIDV